MQSARTKGPFDAWAARGAALVIVFSVFPAAAQSTAPGPVALEPFFAAVDLSESLLTEPLEEAADLAPAVAHFDRQAAELVAGVGGGADRAAGARFYLSAATPSDRDATVCFGRLAYARAAAGLAPDDFSDVETAFFFSQFVTYLAAAESIGCAAPEIVGQCVFETAMVGAPSAAGVNGVSREAMLGFAFASALRAGAEIHVARAQRERGWMFTTQEAYKASAEGRLAARATVVAALVSQELDLDDLSGAEFLFDESYGFTIERALAAEIVAELTAQERAIIVAARSFYPQMAEWMSEGGADFLANFERRFCR